MANKIYIGSDHAGFEYKEKVKSIFDQKKIDYDDLGPYFYKEEDDYPDYAFKVAKAVAGHKGSKGILFCGSGAGMVIAANKVKGVRAVEGYDEYSAKMSRTDNDANILSVRTRDFPFNKVKEIINIWFKTPFSGEERHDRRIRKIMHFEHKK